MQRLADRVRKAERAIAKKKTKETEYRLRAEAWERNQTRIRTVRYYNALFRADRANRAIDWAAGPLLAPRRDAGDKQNTYGAIDIYNLQPPEKEPDSRLEKTEWQLYVGDRVVITRGRDVGKIGEIDEISEEMDAVRVKGLNQIDVFTPEWMKQSHSQDGDTITVDQMISRKDVKLVFPLPDPATGIPRDAVIERLETKVSNGETYRVIPGTTTIIPRPQAVETPMDDQEFDDDTRRISVEQRTFRPFLLRPPMPMTVIDELRNKFSKFRTRHEYEYTMRKQAEEAREQARTGVSKTMRTPLQELAQLRAKQKKLQEKELTRDQLAKIGEAIVQEQARIKATV